MFPTAATTTTTTITMEEDPLENYLNPSHPGSLGGVKRFYRHNRNRLKSLQQAKHLLETSDVYTVNKPARKTFDRNPVIVTNLRQQYQADLADLQKYARQNDGVRYLLVVIDCFSKNVCVVPLRDKSSKEVLAGLKKSFHTLGEPEKLQTDKGREFLNRTIADYFKQHRIVHFSSENDDIKCSMVERFIRTLKTRIWHLFRKRISTRYIDHLEDIVNAYNNTEHRSHGFTPNEVCQENSLEVYNSLRARNHAERQTPKFKVGDYVRISKRKSIMMKGYEANFKEEVYQITKVIPHAIPVYMLKDLLGKQVHGKFYEAELVRVRGFNPDTPVTIDKILQRKGNRIKVRWLGYGKEYDSWINKSCLE